MRNCCWRDVVDLSGAEGGVVMSVVHHGKDTPEEIRQKRIDHHMRYCVHYAPKPGLASFKETPCALGIKAKLGAKPCMDGHKCESPLELCPKWERQSLESAIERHARIEASFRHMAIVGPVVAEWRKRKPIGKQEIIECPACGGRLHLSQAASNGHVHGQCETEGCVSWME